ncbi:MAG: tRNA (adenosine(37)-N6)-threonylcarbamoyltransferase complex transferase subunit TsaD [Myxococcota bacterium]
MPMKILGIETSCDETAASIVSDKGVLSDVIWSQQEHVQFGGVVPEIASRAHIEKLVTTVRSALKKAKIEQPDAVAATAGPGLMGAVLVGLNYAKALAAGWDVPFIGVNHLEGHLLSPLLDDPAPQFPFLSLVVSGGHSTLYLAEGLGLYQVLSQTIDDAAGEVYDKVARMMGLGYPGGPIIDKLAERGDPKAISFPRPRPSGQSGKTRIRTEHRTEMDMSFSGLKTAVRQYLERHDGWSPEDVSASFQAAVIDVLIDRILKGVEKTGVKSIAIGGGVAANTGLRTRLSTLGLPIFVPPKHRCTDNGAMIANVGYLRTLAGQSDGLDFQARPVWRPGVA